MAHDIDTLALEAAERIMQIGYQPMLGGAPQLKAKIQCEVRSALDVLATAKLIQEEASQPAPTGDALLDRLQRAIDEAVTKPGKWVEGIAAGGEIATPWSEQLMPTTIGNMAARRDAWLAIAAVNALPELMDRLRRTKQGERAADQEVERLRALERDASDPGSSLNQRANCWDSIVALLHELAPGWADRNGTSLLEDATHAIRTLAADLHRLHGMLDDANDQLDRLRATMPAATCCGDPGDCAQPCEAERKPDSDDLPEGLSWDQAPEWATVLLDGTPGREFHASKYSWAERNEAGARRRYCHGYEILARVEKSRQFVVVATRPTKKVPCLDCGACWTGPHACGKPGLHGATELADDGWIEWEGGECPVEPEALVKCRYREGHVTDWHHAEVFRWDHATPTKPGLSQSHDIVAYRLHRPS